MVAHGSESPTARIGVVRAAGDVEVATDVIPTVRPVIAPSLLRRVLRTVFDFERSWVTSAIADLAALLTVTVAAVFTVIFRGEFAAQPVIIVAGVVAVFLVIDLLWGITVLWRRHHRARR